jgi:hypothetical protein
MLEVVPEGIFIFDPTKKNTLMANSELLRLLSKHAPKLTPEARNSIDASPEAKSMRGLLQ